MIQVNLKLFIVLLIIIILMEADRCGAVHRVHVSDQLPFQWRRYRQTWSCSRKAIARPAPPVPMCSSDSTAAPAWAPFPPGLGRTPCPPSLMVSASLCLVHWSTHLSVHPPVSPTRVWSVHHCIISIGPHICLSILLFLPPGYGQCITASFPAVHTSVCPSSCFSHQGMVSASLHHFHRSTHLSIHPPVSPTRVWSVHHCIISSGPHICLSILLFLPPGYGQCLTMFCLLVHMSVCPSWCFSVQGYCLNAATQFWSFSSSWFQWRVGGGGTKAQTACHIVQTHCNVLTLYCLSILYFVPLWPDQRQRADAQIMCCLALSCCTLIRSKHSVQSQVGEQLHGLCTILTHCTVLINCCSHTLYFFQQWLVDAGGVSDCVLCCPGAQYYPDTLYLVHDSQSVVWKQMHGLCATLSMCTVLSVTRYEV